MQYNQLKFFPFEDELDNRNTKENVQKNNSDSGVSEKLMKEFETQHLPFFGCDFETVYPKVRELLPKEKVTFEQFDEEKAIICEIISSAICHKINWDYLRDRIYEKTLATPEWLDVNYLEAISKDEVYNLLHTYDKKDRIQADERADIIRKIGAWVKGFGSAKRVFSENGRLLDYESIHNNLMSCSVFSGDPQEKKLQLLLQKLAAFDNLKGLSMYYHPVIDYHLIRSYLRRGLLKYKTKHAKEYIENSIAIRTEKTVAAVRMHCSFMIEEISKYTKLDINTVNLIEWHIGRSVCTQENADCKLESKASDWLKPNFKVCPFYNTCAARCYNKNYLNVKEPNYNGSSY